MHTDLGDGTGVGLCELKIGPHGLGSLKEERDRCILGKGFLLRKLFEVWQCQWWHRKLVFALDVQPGAARYQEFEPGAGGQEGGQLRGCWQDLLKVVEHEQQVLVLERGFQQVQGRLGTGLFESKGPSDGRNDQLWVTDGGKGDEVDAIDKIITQIGRYL